jgi:predicted metalloprotease
VTEDGFVSVLVPGVFSLEAWVSEAMHANTVASKVRINNLDRVDMVGMPLDRIELRIEPIRIRA